MACYETVTYYETVTTQGFFIPTDILQDFEGIIESSLSNIDSPEIEKRFNYVDLDFKGQAQFYLYDQLDELIQSYDLNLLDDELSTQERTTERLYITLENSRPIEKFKYKIITNDRNFKLYSLYLDFEVEEKEGGFSAFPKKSPSA